jgi:hypothetical protein
VHRELNPGKAATRTNAVGLIADNQVRVYALHFLLEYLKFDGLDLNVRTEHPDPGCDHVPVCVVIPFQGHQNS